MVKSDKLGGTDPETKVFTAETKTEAIKSTSIDKLPKNVQKAYDGYGGGNHPWEGQYSGQNPTKGTKMGGEYKNDPDPGDQKLPDHDSEGKKITYKEFDVNNKVKEEDRGNQRFVHGSDGKTYYTNNHYQTFVEVKN